MEKKLIINVGRQIGSGGRIIAKMLADEFDCKFYDREILNLAAKGSGFSEKFFEQNDEQKGFMKGHFHIHLPLVGDNDFYKRIHAAFLLAGQQITFYVIIHTLSTSS